MGGPKEKWGPKKNFPALRAGNRPPHFQFASYAPAMFRVFSLNLTSIQTVTYITFRTASQYRRVYWSNSPFNTGGVRWSAFPTHWFAVNH